MAIMSTPAPALQKRDTQAVEARAQRLERLMRYGAERAAITGVKPDDANAIIHRRRSVAADSR